MRTEKRNDQAMDSEQAKAGFSISSLLGFDRAKAKPPENSDNRHQLNLSENSGERERLFDRYYTQKFDILLHKTFSVVRSDVLSFKHIFLFFSKEKNSLYVGFSKKIKCGIIKLFCCQFSLLN